MTPTAAGTLALADRPLAAIVGAAAQTLPSVGAGVLTNFPAAVVIVSSPPPVLAAATLFVGVMVMNVVVVPSAGMLGTEAVAFRPQIPTAADALVGKSWLVHILKALPGRVVGLVGFPIPLTVTACWPTTPDGLQVPVKYTVKFCAETVIPPMEHTAPEPVTVTDGAAGIVNPNGKKNATYPML